MIITIKALRSNLRVNLYRLLYSLLLVFGMTQLSFSDGGGWTENFNSDPSFNNWSYSGITPDLFNWDSSLGHIDCVWDSGTSLSRFGRGVDFGVLLNQDQSFDLQFDITFSSFSIGAYSNYPAAVGLYNSSTTGNRKIEFLEFDYYLFGFADYVGVSVNGRDGTYSNCSGAFTDNTQAYTLQADTTYHVYIRYNAAAKILNLEITANGNPIISFPMIDLCGVIFDFDRLAITNYLDDTPLIYGGPSTHIITGNVDNIQLVFPLSVNSREWMMLE